MSQSAEISEAIQVIKVGSCKLRTVCGLRSPFTDYYVQK